MPRVFASELGLELRTLYFGAKSFEVGAELWKSLLLSLKFNCWTSTFSDPLHTPTSASLPLFQCTPPQSSPPRLPAPPGGSVKPPTALRHPQSSSPFAFASKTYTQRFKEASVLLGSVPAPRAWTLAVPISGAHVCKVVWPQAGSWDWKALGKFPVPALKTTVLLSPPCRSLGGPSGRAGSSPPPI